MAQAVHSEYQPSITEWFAEIGGLLRMLKDGDEVEVDAENGIIRKNLKAT